MSSTVLSSIYGIELVCPDAYTDGSSGVPRVDMSAALAAPTADAEAALIAAGAARK